MECKFSVIVPIYNAEKYLHRCIESLISQTYKNIEIILIDDGSTDDSAQICKSYSKNDERIKLIRKKNGGLSSARNCGIKNAQGRYIAFVDADDFVDENTYEMINKAMEKSNPDCLDFGWKYVNEEITYNISGIEKEKVLFEKEIREKILPPLLNLKEDKQNFIYSFVWNKIFKKDLIDKNNILFDERRRTWEDRAYLLNYLKYCKTFYSMEKYFYNYVNVPGSLSRRYDLQFFDIIMKNYNSYVEWYGEEYDFSTQYVIDYWCHTIEEMILRSLKEKENKKEIVNSISEILKNEQVVYWYKKRIPKNRNEKKVSDLISKKLIESAIKEYKCQTKKRIIYEKYSMIKFELSKIYTALFKKQN